MSWLLGIGAALGLLVVLALGARSAWRRSVRDEIRRYLATHLPGVRVDEETATTLRLTGGALDGVTFNLTNLYLELSQSEPPELRTEAGRLEVYRRYFDAAVEQVAAANAPLVLDEVSDKILPMLVPAAFADTLSEHAPLPRRELDAVGLAVVYVLDHPQAVQYLNDGHRGELGLTEEALHELAIGNLRARFDEGPVRAALDGSVAVVAAGDGFDATRLLLVPEHLEEGQGLAAVAPDRDTLVLAPLPADDDWSRLRDLAGRPGSDRTVLTGPVRVGPRSFHTP